MTALGEGWLTQALASDQRLWTIPPATSFLDSLADGLLAEVGSDPLLLANVTVLLPTRRSVKSLQEAFLRASNGKPILLPRIMALQDIDEEEALLSSPSANGSTALNLAPPIASLTRKILLARQIMELQGPDEQTPGPEQAVMLAQELSRLLDQVQTEQLSFDALSNLVPDDLAAHWQITVAFLNIVTHYWPEILNERGVIDPAEHRNQVFTAQTEAWLNAPPKGLIIAAGSTGSIPATRDLLATIVKLPSGCIVLPGLDQRLDSESWAAVEESHPQFTLKALLSSLKVDRSDVSKWPQLQDNDLGDLREAFVSEIMRPAATSDQWRTLDHMKPGSAFGLQRIEAPTPREESAAIALVLRSALEDEGLTAALVTPDRALARRVSAELERWELTVDDSGGQHLAETSPAVFLRLTASMVYEQCAPVPLLSALKHPLAAGGMDPPAFRDHVRTLEQWVLRGPRPPDHISGLRLALAEQKNSDPALEAWLAELESVIAPFENIIDGDACPLHDIVNAHVFMAETLAASNEQAGPLRLWQGYEGEALAVFIADMLQATSDLGAIHPHDYLGLLAALMKDQTVRPPYGSHPRLSILGPLEARLLHPDVVILAGLNEGTWPADTDAGPWMSRPMRKSFGLPQPERRIGQAAHDIAQSLCAPKVILTRSLRVDGTPTVPSRWWRRFDQVLDAAGLTDSTKTDRYPWLSWAIALTLPNTIAPLAPPAPRPPVAARPRRLSVTEVETWMRDPYEIYAHHVLGLRALDPIDADASSADYGIIVHRILQTFVETYPDSLPDDPLDTINGIANSFFDRRGVAPGVLAFWRPRFDRIAEWFVGQEVTRREVIRRAHAEVKGSHTLNGPAGPFELVAKADRIDQGADGTLAIIDYKTGAVPSVREVEAGYAPQLPLEAVIAAAGGFANIPAAQTGELSYWRLTGRGDGGESSAAGEDTERLRANALEGVLNLIATFDDPNTPYTARPHPDMAPSYGDTQHLARVKEWLAAGGGGS